MDGIVYLPNNGSHSPGSSCRSFNKHMHSCNSKLHQPSPVRFRSDNGKNFVGANNEGKRFHEVFDCHHIEDDLAVKGVEWIFNAHTLIEMVRKVKPTSGG